MSTRFPARLPDLLADDRALLARYADRRDETAFAALVRRHGGMVLGVCRRAVRDHQLAEDAFQAVFLVLARNPTPAVRSASVGGWLFGVARRVGLAARRHRDRSARRDRRAVRPPAAEPAADWSDLLRVLDEELAALPEQYRDPLLACFLRERTQDEAARELGWSLSTLRRRLDRGKELLRDRLARRGTALSAALFAGAVVPTTATAKLVETTRRLAAGTDLVPPTVTALAAGGAARVGVAPGVAAGVLLLGGLVVGLTGPETPTGPPAAVARETAILPAPPPAEARAAVSGRVVFPAGREVPARREITRTDAFVKDADCCFASGRKLFFESFVVDPATRGVRDAVVWLRPAGGRNPTHLPRDGGGHREHVVGVVGCQFVPRVTVARAGDTLRFDNAAACATTVDFRPAAGSPAPGFNVLLAGSTGTYRPDVSLAAASAPARFRSGIHPWMEGAVWVFDHPYYWVTDAAGRFVIPDVPAGPWQVAVWHEKTGAAGGRLPAIELAPGAADLGTIALDDRAWDEPNTGE